MSPLMSHSYAYYVWSVWAAGRKQGTYANNSERFSSSKVLLIDIIGMSVIDNIYE